MIDRATLLKIARDTANQRMAARRSIVSAYLTGSVAANEPLLGEATDIDLIFIDADPPTPSREILRLTDQIALDIEYRAKTEYANPKLLRVHPWRGPELCEPFFLNDPHHFFELAQSSARGQFHRPEFVATRARAFVDLARAALHLPPVPGAEPYAPVALSELTHSLLYLANAVISLTAFPGAGRRLTLKLDTAARQLAQPELYTRFIALFGVAIGPWLADWSATYRAAQTPTEELIHPARRTLYERGFQALLAADRAADGAWLLTTTWQALMEHLPTDRRAEHPLTARWQAYLTAAALDTPEAYTAKVTEACAYVDFVADFVEAWVDSNGA